MSDLIGQITGYFDIFKANTVIDGFSPDVTYSTFYRDQLVVTRHPVEQGATITDHAFKEPPEVEVRIGFSDAGLNGTGYAKKVYNQLVELQASRRLITVSTGKRLYTNCLITAVSTETTEGFVFSSVVSLRIQQVLLAKLSVSPVPDKAAQAAPASTAAPAQNGPQNPTPPTPANRSALDLMVKGAASGINAPTLPNTPGGGP